MEMLRLPEEYTDPPPPYFSVVIEEPLRIQNPGNNSTVKQTTRNFGVYPNLNAPTMSYPNPAAYPGQSTQPPYAQMPQECQSSIERVLASQEKLSFLYNNNTGQRDMIIRILGNENQLVMSTLITTNRRNTNNRDGQFQIDNERRVAVAFSDPTGINIMKCKVVRDGITVKSGNKLLGIIRGTCKWSDTFEDRPYAQNSNGEIIFKIVDPDRALNFVFNGRRLASARKGVVKEDEFGVEFLRPVDCSTKAMIVAASYFLCLSKYGKNSRPIMRQNGNGCYVCVVLVYVAIVAAFVVFAPWLSKN